MLPCTGLRMPELSGSNCFSYHTQFSLVQCRTLEGSKQAWVKYKIHVQQQYCLKTFPSVFLHQLLISALYPTPSMASAQLLLGPYLEKIQDSIQVKNKVDQKHPGGTAFYQLTSLITHLISDFKTAGLA